MFRQLRRVCRRRIAASSTKVTPYQERLSVD
jgi:hypothetical protein